MERIVFLNATKIDFDSNLDFSSLRDLGILTNYVESNDKEILERVQDQNIVITKEIPLGKELIEQFPPSVKLICEAGTGFNNIDLEAAANKGIAVCNVPGYSTEGVAQLAITYILNFASSMIKQQRMIQQDNYSNFTEYLKVPHFEVQEKYLGIIGAGTIGMQVIKTARALGMNVLTYDPTPRQFEDSKIQAVTLEELLQKSDFISLHCPLTAGTRHIINKDTLKLMKPTAFIINTSRGPLINETDLIEALQNGVIAGAGLDVQDPEPPSLDNPLFKMDNAVLTPHIGWRCIESRQRLVELLSKNIEAFANGNPINIVG
ncbi:NAD(P)-dependent oxidoreductase [Serpentinicella alkaliphila]|uniref:Glycerate dehydrogenase n=1 Tax=Serpentinicella alkaliphila TaxID=1734049 RepID=A0A4R2T753_9FIRM|nr:NAD(P)-dependent oxidoreductase [Serpentinicella alkaliphila]QUH24401.1 D-2-hydroxyacid dehydrogenase [Serpentinicella alkaliphila]TCP98360.1 glycerate dehydrogenase [Serpentinicella alkaliphila]